MRSDILESSSHHISSLVPKPHMQQQKQTKFLACLSVRFYQEMLSSGQRRVTRTPNSLKSFSYNERLEHMGLTSLEKRRVRGDLIELYKIKNELESIVWHKSPIWSEARVPKRSQLRREIVLSCQSRHNFFLNRVANHWNKLPNDVVESESVEVFKCKLDRFL